MSGPLDHLTPPDPLMAGPWAGALHWALGEPEIMERFRAETGNHWKPGRGLDATIDQATGADAAFLVAFTGWFNENIWGDINRQAFSGEDEATHA